MLSVTVIVLGNGIEDSSSHPGRECLFLPHANAIGKGMNPALLFPAMGK